MTIDAAAALSVQRVASEAGFRVARKMLDIQEQQGQAAVALIQAAAELAESVAAAAAPGPDGLGSLIDVTA